MHSLTHTERCMQPTDNITGVYILMGFTHRSIYISADGPIRVMVVPIPVPVYIPVPMAMYSQYCPAPMSIPLPVG